MLLEKTRLKVLEKFLNFTHDEHEKQLQHCSKRHFWLMTKWLYQLSCSEDCGAAPAMRARGDAVLPPVTRQTFAYATPKVQNRLFGWFRLTVLQIATVLGWQFWFPYGKVMARTWRGAAILHTGQLLNCFYIVIQLLFDYKTKNNRITDE